MPLIDVQCTLCSIVSEVYRPLSMWPATPPCPHCGGLTDRAWIAPGSRATPDPVVVYQMPDGSYRFPGQRESLATRRYDSQGGVRLEFRGWQEVRPFEKLMNDRESRILSRRFERQQQAREQSEHSLRSELRSKMESMTEAGRLFCKAVMHRNDRKPLPRPHDPGFRVEAYTDNRSNREESRDAQGRRHRD